MTRTLGEKAGDTMTFRQSRDAAESNSAASAGLTSTGEREAPILIDDEAEEVPRIAAEDTHGPSLTKGEDPVRLYLKEIGKVSLLTAAQEVQIGRRIEVGQIALRHTLAGIPMSVEALLEAGDGLRRGDIPADDVIVLAEGGELDAKELRPVLLAFGRVRRLQRKIAGRQDSLGDKRRSTASRTSRAKTIAA